MAERLVAADSSPLIGLAAAGAFDLLQELFGTVVVTSSVRDEVAAGEERPGAGELDQAIKAGWIKVEPSPPDSGAFPELGAGEASTILLATQADGECLVLMDEPAGRARAAAQGVPVTGLAGLLLGAKRSGLIGAVRPYLERLAEANFRVSDEVLRTVLEEAGEADG